MNISFQKIILCILISLVAVPVIVQAQTTDKNVGIGLMIGEPTGISYKNWINDRNAFDFGLTWSFGRHDAVGIHGDYLWHNYNVFSEIEKGTLPLYYGVGGRLIFDDDDAVLGVRIPVGVEYFFTDAPVGVFFEIAPIVDLVPDAEFDGNIGIGIRYYF